MEYRVGEWIYLSYFNAKLIAKVVLNDFFFIVGYNRYNSIKKLSYISFSTIKAQVTYDNLTNIIFNISWTLYACT